MIPAPPGYVAYFLHADHEDELVREVVAFDDGGVALVVDVVGGRLVPVTRLDGWEFRGLASSPRRRQFEFEGVIREVEVHGPAPDVDEDDEPRWCEARPPQPEHFCEEDNDDEEAIDD
jgi:hypothetical protein